MITVYKFRCPWWWEIPAVVDEQLRLAHQLRMDLVQIEEDHEATRSAVYATDEGVATAQEVLTVAEGRVVELVEKVRDERIRQRTRNPTHPAVGELAVARSAERGARAAVKAARKAAERTDGAALKERLAGAARDRDQAIKATYHAYCQAPPVEQRLYHATWNDVVEHHRTAVQRMISTRAEGRPSQLRRARFTGEGTLTVLLVRNAWSHGCAAKGPPWPCAGADAKRPNPADCPDRRPKDPRRSPELFSSGGGKWRNILQVPQGQPYGEARMRIGPGLVGIPVAVDHEMDPDADITLARLTVRRTASKRRAHLSVTARIPDPLPVDDGPMVAVHCGWRRERDDSVRVATWRASEPVTVPDHLRDVVRQDSDTTGTVSMPAAWRDKVASFDDLAAERDKLLNETRDELAAWLDENPQEDDRGTLTGSVVRRWRAAGRFAALALRWRDDPPLGGRGVADMLESWRRADKKMWERHAHGRAKALGRRDDGWRRFAAWVSSIAGAVVVDDSDLASLTRRVTREDTDVPREVTVVAARQRVDAAPGLLRDAVVHAAKRDGVSVSTVPAAGLSATCPRCDNDGNDASTRVIECDGCGHRYDRDTSATLLMLARASGPSGNETPRSAR